MNTNSSDNRGISCEIVKELGSELLPTGKSLREHFTIDEISLWDVMTPSMSLYYVPNSISLNENKISIFRKVRPRITCSKHKFLNVINRYKTPKFGYNNFTQEGAFMFMGFNGYMYNDILAPLAREIASEGKEKIIVVHDAVNCKVSNSDESNIFFHSTWQYWDEEAADDARVLKCEVKKRISEIAKMLRAKELKLNTIYAQNIIQYAFNWLLRFDFPLLVNKIVLSKLILQRNKPSLIISPDVADLRSRVYMLTAKQEGIPTLELQYGDCDENSYEWDFLLADHIAVWGKKSRDSLLKHKVPRHKMTITGTARNDPLVNANPLVIKNMKSKLGLNDNNIIVLFASTYQQKEYNSFSAPELNKSMKKAIFDSANKAQGLVLIVKPHPLEDLDETRSLLSSDKNIVFVPASQDIRDLINACDVFVGLGTTATVDAMIANKLIICPVFCQWPWSEWIVKSNSTMVPKSKVDIERIFSDLADGYLNRMKSKLQANRKTFISNIIHKPDGFSSKRISQLASDLVIKSQSEY